MLVYFAEPIDFDLNGSAEADMREALVEGIRAKGHVVYRPAKAWSLSLAELTDQEAVTVEYTNRRALARADVIVARLPVGQVTHGVPMEIEFATRQRGIPAIVVGHTGVAMRANPLVWPVDPMAEPVGAVIGVLDTIGSKGVPLNGGRVVRYSGPEVTTAYKGDAGLDLTTLTDTVVQPGESEMIPTGVSVQIPEGMFGWVVARSSAWKHFGLIVLPGIIDQPYEGDLMVHALNLTPHPVRVKMGERVGQLLLIPNGLYGRAITNVSHDGLHSGSDRGAGGFGSSGR